jgi:hypothetical protein
LPCTRTFTGFLECSIAAQKKGTSRDVDWRETKDPANRLLEFIEDSTGGYQRIVSRYDEAGRLMETVDYDRSGKLRGKVRFKYAQEDTRENWTEEQVWEGGINSEAPKLSQVARPTTQMEFMTNRLSQ